MNQLFSNRTLHEQNQCVNPGTFGSIPVMVSNLEGMKRVAERKKTLRCILFFLSLLGSFSFVNGQGYLKKANTAIYNDQGSLKDLKSLGW